MGRRDYKTYHVVLSEGQRQIFLQCLREAPNALVEIMKKTVSDEFYDTVDEERNALIDMIGALPDEEAKQPGILHGLAW